MDKIDRLLDAIEHPDLYSETDIETMLADSEVREVYDMLAKTVASLSPMSSPDVNAEWEAFEKSHPATQARSTGGLLKLFTRNIAASIAIAIASLAAVAAVVGVSVNYVLDKKADSPATEQVAVVIDDVIPDDSITVAEEARVTAPETITFDNEPLETIATQIADYYGYKAEFSTDSAKSLRLYFRWNQALSLDEVVECLNNFEQIHISVKDKTLKID